MSSKPEKDLLRPLLIEIWERFHPAILWWADKRAATDPGNIHLVYKELLSGPRGAMDYAARLRPFLSSPAR
ncbi:hypothetical protein EV656_104240 [Rhodovulum adriaticum]|uniref:Uncharacterized protein n=1 Tax=Rhodovulum adriaticum TaxID=35804 RepID=A0A4R2NPR1_RHOAD|nr:hypothetical protein EV656_104240 [Rhodovulum adriaticum]